ncbi:phage terminase large subunit-like protein [Novosphingobium chloroacetimidivorans]|uniref:Phage terminase large subunit-like protein n=1 Tax=Novosphingobium chloroacetimidivorans TaxID=1428314 RepID=A0A7W7KAW9_9SPHN|nr:terminase TerL endonuclease subunit [Novosphingobium chloroacetimidivorans]MBB4859457.1 phage terminase large subunit-like protein [Novosphingobium chloroacetimidivorans]
MFADHLIERDTGRADRVIAFLELLPIVDGALAGTRLRIDPWMAEFIRDIYEPHSAEGSRLVRRAVLSVARKVGKSYLVAGLLLAHLVGPEAQPNSQIYSCANDREQASVIFNICRKMIEMSPGLAKVLKVVNSTKTIMVMSSTVKGRGSVYKALSAETSTKHGLHAQFFVYDELGESKTDELWNTIFDSQQTIRDPLAIAISTQNNDPQHPLSLMIDDGLRRDDDGNKVDESLVVHLHAADEECDLLDEAQWIKANPACLTWKSIEPIRVAAEEAARLPSKEANFRRRYLNQRVNPYTTLISQAAWKGCRADAVEFTEREPVYLGLDMSFRDDLTALVMVSAGPEARCRAWFWKPSDLISDHTKRDGVRYDLYAQQGRLEACPGVMITPRSVAIKIAELCQLYDVRGLAYDRYGTRELLGHFDEIGLAASDDDKLHGGLRLVGWGQGYKDMSPAVMAFEESIITKALVHDGGPLLTMCVMNALVKMDEAGNRKLDKSKSRFKIDGAQALAMALGLKVRDGNQVAPVSPWEDPAFSISRL